MIGGDGFIAEESCATPQVGDDALVGGEAGGVGDALAADVDVDDAGGPLGGVGVGGVAEALG